MRIALTVLQYTKCMVLSGPPLPLRLFPDAHVYGIHPQHNLAAASRLYGNIATDQLGRLLGVSAEAAEGIAADMVAEGRMLGSIDQVSERHGYCTDVLVPCMLAAVGRMVVRTFFGADCLPALRAVWLVPTRTNPLCPHLPTILYCVLT